MGLTLFFVLGLAATTIAGPIQEKVSRDQCAKQCTVSNKFNYEIGKTYEFKYDTELRTAVLGASEDQAGVDMSAKVYIDFLSKCEMVIRMSDVKMSEHDPETSTMKPMTTDLISELERNPLMVSFQDGKIEELCLSKPESDKILNIKRGILSLIQNTMDDISKDQTVTESDVSGNCETEYTSKDNGWYNKIIKKSKNLLGCTSRQNSNSAIQGIPYSSKSDVQSLPLIKSTHECQQEIVSATGRLQVAKCTEQHKFLPFSRLDSGATTHNTQTLTFVQEYKSKTKPEEVSVRVPVQFQHSGGDSAKHAGKDMEQKLMEICASTKDGVTPETPKLFTSLVYTMKTIDSSDLFSIYKKINSKEICSVNNDRVKKFFLDAIPMTGTRESLKMMVQLLSSEQVTGLDADMWMTTLAFIQNPTIDMLADVKPLLSMKSNQEKAMLSVSSLVHTVCKNDPTCENFLEVKKIISLLESQIAPSCKISDKTYQTSLLALRAIGNAGYGNTAMPTLTKCYKRTENPIEIRLSAIEAFRRIPCKADKSMLLSVFLDNEEDSEIRIAAYKSLMECPTDYLISKVKGMLAKEEVNQVGSYVWSHLTNLMETSNPHKQAIKSILQDETLQKEFNLDNRKFSRNYEKSLFIEKINAGAVAEGDLIWSSKSFIPRSAMANLTIGLFGSEVNLFEIGGRVEGLEYFLESYFGPNGYFSENDVKEAVKETAVDLIKSDKVKRIDKRNNRVMEELRGSLYIRVFGNELRYMNFQGLDALFSQNNFNILDMMMALGKEKEYQYTHSSMIMDSSVIVPTSSGIPLNLKVNGTASVDVKASGKMDIMKMPSIDIRGIIRPSAAVVVSSIMSIDALDTHVGIKMVSTLHSSTSVQGKVSLSEGKVLNVEFDLPEDKQDIISVRSSFYTVHRNSEREQKMITENRQTYNACTGNKLAKITGLELCSELSFPNASLVENAPYFPLTGPINAGLSLYKRDKTMTGYKIEARSTHNADENVIRLAFSTPNSLTDRTFALDLNLNKAQGAFDASFNSPWRKADFKGTFVYDNTNKGISGKLNWDGSVRFDLKAHLQSERSGPGMIYTPTVHISAPGINPVSLRGTVKYAPWKIFETDVSLSGIYPAPITVKSSIQNKAKIMSASASLQFSPKKIYSLDSSIQTTEYKKKIVYKSVISVRSPSQELLAFAGTFTNVYGKNIELDMVLDKIIEKPIIIKTNVITKSYRRGRVQKIVRLDFRSKLMDIKMKNKFDNRNGKTFATDTDLTYVIRKYARDNIKLVTKIINQSSKSLTKARASMNLASKRYPAANFKLISNLNHNKRHSEIETDIAYGPNFKDVNKQISFSMSMDRAIKSFSQASVTLNGKLLAGSDLRIITKLDHTHEPKSIDSKMMLRVNKAVFSSSLSLKDKSKDLKDLFGNFDLELPGGKSFIVSQTLKENSPSNFTSTMYAKLGKSVNAIVTSWKKASPSALTISSDIKLSFMDPVQLGAEYTLGPELYKIGASVQRASSKYSAVVTSQVDSGKSIQISTDIASPSRHIVGNFEGTKYGNRFTSRTDIRWNADRDDTQRVTINGKGQLSSLSNVEGSFTVQYPSRTIAINLKNTAGNKYTTHFDFQWEPSKVISIDSTFGDYKKDDAREIISNVKLSTPFSFLKTIDLTLDHYIKPSMYQTKFDAKWKPNESLSAVLTARKPMTLKSFDIDLIGKAPSLGYKTIQSSLKHSVENGVSTVGKVVLNRQTAQVDLSLLNKGDASKSDVKGQLDIKTSYRQLRTASISFSHRCTGNNLDSSAFLKYNKKQYGVESSLKGKLRGYELNTDGDITIFLPSDKIKATWGHRNSFGEMTTTSEITWENKRIFFSLNGLQNLGVQTGTLSAAMEIQTPFSLIQDVVLQLNHLHKPGQIDSTMKITGNGHSVAAIETKYLKENGKITSRVSTSNAWYDGLLLAVMNADYASQPKTAHLELSMAPLKAITLDGTFNKNTNNDISTSITITVPNKPTIEFSASRQKAGSSVNSAISLKYQEGKIIRLDSVHRIGAIKQVKLKFTSPYTAEYSIEGVFQKSQNSIRVNANIEAEPFISKWSVTTRLDNSNGISGNFKVDTPYQNVPYSQVSFLSEIVDNSRQSSIVAEYVPGRVIKINSIYQLKSYNDMHLSIELSTPYDIIPRVSTAFKHQGDLTSFSNYGEIEFGSEKVSVESRFSNINGIKATVTMTSPYNEDLSATLEHNGNINSFVSHGEITMGKTITADLKHEGSIKRFESYAKVTSGSSSYSSSINFNLGPKMVTEINVETPIANYEHMHLSHTFEGQLNMFSHKMEFSKTGFGSLSSNVNANFDSQISLTVSAQTPFKNFRDMKAAFVHEGSLSRFSTQAEFQNGLSEYSGDIKLSTTPAFNFEATLKTPAKNFKLMRLSASNDGPIDNFKLHAEAQINKEISEVDLICNIQKKYDIDLTIRSPYTETIKASLDHWGTWKKFQSKLNIRSGKDKITSNIKFAIKPTFNALISVRSPFPLLKNQYLSLKHAGSLNSFKCNMQYKCNGKSYNGDASFQNLNGLKAEAMLKGPTFRPINVAITHNGELSSFKSVAAMSMGKKAVEANASWNTLNGIKGTLGFKTPFEGYEQMNVDFSHSGKFNNFKSHGEIMYNRKSGQIDILVDSTRDIAADITILTPFKEYRDITSSLKHSGTIKNFNTLVNFALAGKSVEGKASFQTSPFVTGSASIKSSFESIGNGDISFSHEGDLKKFNTNGELNIGDKRSSTNAAFDFTQGYEGRVNIDSPILKKTNVEFKHVSTDNSYTTNAVLESNGRKYKILSDLSRMPMSGILTINTPHTGFESTELSVHHAGTTKDFRSSVTLDIFGGKYESEIVFSTHPDVQVSLTLQSPIYDNIETSLIYQGKLTDFNTRFNYLYGTQSQMLVESALKTEGPYTGNLKITSPLMKNIEAFYSHNGGLNSFKSEATVTFAGKTTDARISLQINPDIETSVRFTSPLTKDLDITFAHTGPITACKTTGFVKYGKQKHIEIDGQFDLNSKLNAAFTISTSLPEFNKLSTVIYHEGDLSGFKCHGEISLNDKLSTGDIKYSPREGSIKISTPYKSVVDGSYKYSPSQGSIMVFTPFTEELKGLYKINYKPHNSEYETSLAYGSKQILGLRGNYEKTGEIDFELSVPDYENSRILLKRVGDIGGSVVVDIKGTRHEAEFIMNLNSRKSASASIQSPLMPKMSSDISFTGTLLNFQSHCDFVFEDQKHELDLHFTMERQIEGSLFVNFPVIPEFSTKFATNKDLTNLVSSADISYQSKKIFNFLTTTKTTNKKALNIDVTVQDNTFNFASSFDGILTDFNAHVKVSLNEIITEVDSSVSLDPVSVSISLNSPMTGPISSSFDIDGSMDNFKAQGQFSVNSKKNEGMISFNANPLRAYISIKSMLKDITISVSNDGNIRNFKSQAEMNIGNQKAKGEIIFNIETAVEGSVDLNLPGRKPIRASFEHSQTLKNIKNVMAVEYGGDIIVSSDVSLSYNPVKASVSIKTPFEGYRTASALFSHSGKVLNFNNHVEITIEDKTTQGDMTFNFGSKLEGRFSARSPYFPSSGLGFELSGNMVKFTTNADVNFGENKFSVDASVDTRVGIDASVSISTPLQGYKTVISKFSHTGTFPNIKSFAQIKSGRRNMLTASTQLDSTNGLSGKISIQSVLTPTIQASMEHTRDLNNFNTKVEMRINGRPSTAIIGFKTAPFVSGIASFTSPYTKPVSGSFEIKSLSNQVSFHIDGSYDSQSIVSEASLAFGNTMTGMFEIKTPFTGFEDTKGSLKFSREYKGFVTNADIVLFGNKLEAEAKSSWRQAVTGSLTVKTPFENFKQSSADFSFAGSFPQIQTEVEVSFTGQRYFLSSIIDKTVGRLTINTPIKGFETITASFNHEGTLKNFQSEARINYMVGKEVFVSFKNILAIDRLNTIAKIKTPYTEDLSFELTFNGQPYDFTNTLAISAGESNSATSKTLFKLTRDSLDFDSSLQSILAGYSDEQKLRFEYEDMKTSASAKILGSYYSFESNMQFDVDDSLNAFVAFRTPFVNLRDVSLNFEHTGSSRRFNTKSQIQYDTGKKIETNIQYVKYGWRRLQSSVEIKTPFAGFETSKIAYRHTASVDSFECDADMSFLNKDLNGNIRASVMPLSISVSASTPFVDFEQIGAASKITYGSGSFNAEASVQYMKGKTIALSSDLNSMPPSATMTLTTPFKGFENSEIVLSTSGDIRNFQTTMTMSSIMTPELRVQANMRYISLTNLDGSLVLTSKIKHLENLRLTLRNEANRGKYNSKMEMSWAPAKSIIFDGLFTDNRYIMSADMVLSTPFTVLRELKVKSETSYRDSMYTQTIFGKYNGNVFTDLDMNVNMGNKKSALMLIRSPVTMKVELEGSIEDKYQVIFSMSKDIDNANKGIQVNGILDPKTNTISLKQLSPINSISFDGTFLTSGTKFDLVMNGKHYGYDMEMTGTNAQAKIILPSRSLKVSGSQQSGTTEGTFMWDADKDETRKVGFRTVMRPTKDSMNADLTLMMPSIGKEVQIDSHMSLNKGRILFDGKTELTYSRDIQKKFTIMSRLEDISNSWSAKNYSFTFGISHPYTSVDVQVSSQFGKSNEKLTGGINMNYQTVKRDVKTFSVNGEINKVRNTFFVNMDTPMKKIGINGNAKNVSPYRLSLSNKYDTKQPLNTVFTFDSDKRIIDFQMNYDIENPNSEFHVSAKYVNSSAIAAEVFHVVNRQRVTDSLFALRLNSSSLLHSRIHWRPDLINDIKALSEKKLNKYGRHLKDFVQVAARETSNEMNRKADLIRRSFEDEIEPIVAIFSEMYETNAYHVRDITDATLKQLADIEQISEKYVTTVKEKFEDKFGNCFENCKEKVQSTLIKIENAAGYIVLKSADLYKKYSDHAYNLSKPMTKIINDKYNNYVQYMNQIDTSKMAETYTTAIYGARDLINSRLSSVMPNGVYQHGRNAYKYWEVRENTEMVGRAIVDWIKEEIEKELSDLKATVLNLMKTKVTVYDPSNGEIQMDMHLPVPLKSLDVIPKVDIVPFVTKAKSYIPSMPRFSMPSSDISTWLPPFDAMATIEGNKITTFDGVTYNLENSCTFILARDYVNSNFSVVLNRNGNNKTIVIISGQTSIKLFSNGKVTVNNNPIDLPAIVRDVSVTSLDGHVTVNVAGHLSVDYYQDLDTYMVKMNGYYFGKTNGLFGTYDNEPTNDLMTSFGKVTNSAERFAKTWDVGTEHCR